MFRRIFPTLFIAVATSVVGVVHAVECDMPGTPIQWIADYCMAKIGTDDEIAASDCIATENLQHPGGDCETKGYFKRKLCKVLIESGARTGPVDACADDRAFVGSTVRNGGVGGQRPLPTDARQPAGSEQH